MVKRIGTDLADNLQGTTADDILYGNVGDDELIGLAGNDRLYGGDGADTFTGGAGADLFDGTPGLSDSPDDDFDAVDYSRDGGSRSVTVNLARKYAIDSYGQRDKLIDIEGVTGTRFADVLIGGAAQNTGIEQFAGLAGNDTIDGGTGFDEIRYDREHSFGGTRGINANLATGRVTDTFGNTDTVRNIEAIRGSLFGDTMTGSSGDNRFRPLAGNDTVNGGLGIDQIDYRRDVSRGGDKGVVVDLAKETATDGFGNIDRLISIENAIGTDKADRITGSAVANRLLGFGDDDTIDGGGGNDTVDGGDGDDRISGGLGNDILIGGAGYDTFTGGSGADRFQFTADTGIDTMTDFLSGTDKLVIDTDEIKAGTSLVTGKSFILGGPTAATQAAPTFLYVKASGNLYYDVDGKGGDPAELIAKLAAGASLLAGDFILT